MCVCVCLCVCVYVCVCMCVCRDETSHTASNSACTNLSCTNPVYWSEIWSDSMSAAFLLRNVVMCWERTHAEASGSSVSRCREGSSPCLAPGRTDGQKLFCKGGGVTKTHGGQRKASSPGPHTPFASLTQSSSAQVPLQNCPCLPLLPETLLSVQQKCRGGAQSVVQFPFYKPKPLSLTAVSVWGLKRDINTENRS